MTEAKEPRINVTLKMSPDLWNFLRLTATLTGVSRSDIMAGALKSYPWLKEKAEELKDEYPGYARKAKELLRIEEGEAD